MKLGPAQTWLSLCVPGYLLLAGCSPYDASLLQHSRFVRSGGGTAGHPRSASDAAAAHNADAAVLSDLDSDGGGENEFPRTDAGLQTRCGDGRVSGGENCDIAIAQGQPGACPNDTACTALGTCSPRAINNKDTCQAECIVLPDNCKGGDGCCPGSCTPTNDSDCSASCHDGIVQTDRGETCEPESKTSPCKTAADCDDGAACTLDMLIGSPDNCNVDCVHTKITALHDGDGCCPDGGNNNTDKDCVARCGNGIQEQGEDCDGGDGCTADCKSNSPPPQMPPPDMPTACPDTGCTNSCFPAGAFPCCTADGICGCTWAPGAYCL